MIKKIESLIQLLAELRLESAEKEDSLISCSSPVPTALIYLKILFLVYYKECKKSVSGWDLLHLVWDILAYSN